MLDVGCEPLFGRCVHLAGKERWIVQQIEVVPRGRYDADQVMDVSIEAYASGE